MTVTATAGYGLVVALVAFRLRNDALALALATAPVALLLPALGGYALVGLGVLTITFTGITVGPMTLPDLFLVAGGILLALTRGRQLRPPATWVVVGGVGILAAAVVGSLLGSGPRLDGAVRLASAMVYIPTVIAWAGTTAENRRSLAACYVVSASINAMVALLASIGVAVIGSPNTPLPSSFNDYRAAGLTVHSNQLGLACALAIPLVMALYPANRRWIIAGGACVVGVGLSGSRAGLLAAALGVVIYLAVTERFGIQSFLRVLVTGVVGVVMLMTLGINISFDRLIGETERVSVANEARVEVAADAWRQFRGSPLVGVGYGGAHNLYLTLAQGGGLLALAAFAFYVRGAVRAGRRIRHGPVDAAGLSMVILWLLAGSIHNGYYDRYLYFGFGLVLAAAIERKRAHARDRNQVANTQMAVGPPMVTSSADRFRM